MHRRLALIALAVLTLNGCASLSTSDPLQVTVAGVESLPGEGLELRMLVKLRVQNPNQATIDYSGVYVKLDVQGKTFATGVSDQRGTLAGFSEAIVSVPVSVSVLRMARQVMGMLDGQPVDRIRYDMRGKLSRGGLRSLRFQSQGEFALPKSPAAATGIAGS
jgi:LEA14-like dessication related protein